MWNNVWLPESRAEAETSAAILDDRKAYDKAQLFDISILQGYKYENIEKYKQFGVPKGMHCYSALKASIGARWRFRPYYMLAGTETLFHMQISMGINEFNP